MIRIAGAGSNATGLRRRPVKSSAEHAERDVGDVAGNSRNQSTGGPGTAAVVFTPSGLRGRFEIGTTVLQAARSLGVDLESACGGRGLCGRCQVTPGLGNFAKYRISAKSEHLSPASDYETERAGIMALGQDRRLGCLTKILGDMLIDVPADSQLHRQRISKDAEPVDHAVDAAVKCYVVTVAEADMHNPSSDFMRLKQALEKEHDVRVSHCDLGLLQSLQKTLKAGAWTVTVAVYDDTLVQAVWPGFKEGLYGLAVDLGSTTIAAHLLALDSGQVVASAAAMNPQIRFGEDLMSRVSYVMMNEGGDVEMSRAVHLCLNELAGMACAKAGVEVGDIMELVVVGNPVMHHLFLGIDPTPLGSAPFALATEGVTTVKASELGIELHPQARVCVLPCLAGHVGADTAAMILARKPWLSDEICLLVDVGTNAEIVLGNRDRLLAASSPTGPAFEGAQISCGQRAASGAIERVRIDRQTFEPRFRVIGCELWSDEPGFAEATAAIGVSGVCGSGIIEVIAELYLAGVINRDGVIMPPAGKSSRIIADGRTYAYLLHEQDGVVLKITQNDVRAIQLAKAALYAGIKLLMDHLGISRPDKILIAGAFGSHIDARYAMVLGLIPDCRLSNVISIGNAAGTGARIALMDHKERRLIESVLRQVEKIETAIEPRFQEHFVEAMAIPHKTDSFEMLRKELSLPETTGSDEGREQRSAGRPGARRRRKKSA